VQFFLGLFPRFVCVKECVMKLSWFLFLSLLTRSVSLYAEDSPPPSPSADAASPSFLSESDANKSRALKGGKISPRQRAALAKDALGEVNQQEGQAFLAANQAKPGVFVLPSGVQYKILKKGSGKKPAPDSLVACRYQGTLIDGRSFDKSDAKKPAQLQVSGFLPGLKEAVLLMSAGSVWEVVIPPALAYGSLGNRGVGPNAVLLYHFELVAVP
jgi:FKBP-type peptidyl-prolyl cis-trans isomerase